VHQACVQRVCLRNAVKAHQPGGHFRRADDAGEFACRFPADTIAQLTCGCFQDASADRIAQSTENAADDQDQNQEQR
jgi:hypothetical protein